MKKLIPLALLLMTAACATAGNRYQDGPVGIGKGPNTLKRSQCACNKIELKEGIPEDIQTQQG